MLRFTFFALLFSILSTTQVSASDADYVILPGDVLQITVWKEEGMDQEVVILPSGAFTFPLIGTVNAKGKTPEALKVEVLKKLRPFIREAALTIAVKAPLGHRANVIGEVQAPGNVLLSADTTITQAISQVGGFTPYADKGDIIVIRKDEDGVKKKIEFSFNRLAKGRDLNADISLLPGDIVIVPSAGLF